jgi:hypothetical protein
MYGTILSHLDAVAASMGLLRESARTKKGRNPWGYAGGSKSIKREDKGMREFEMFEKPSYSRASSMESIGSGITLAGKTIF